MNQINSTQITVNDKNIVLASNNNADNHIEDGGLILQGTTTKSILWKSTDGWKSSEKITAPNLKINGVGTFNSIDSGSGLITTTGIGSFGSIQCGIGTFTKIDTTESQLIIGNSQVGLNLNFSGNNLHINGNVPKAGQVLVGNGSEVKWANTDNSLINNQLIKVVTETASGTTGTIFNSASRLDLISNNTQTYTAQNSYTLNQETKKIIIIFNFAVFDSNLVSKIKLEVLINDVSKKSVIFKNMTGNQINDIVKYFTLTNNDFDTGSNSIKFRFTDMNSTGTIKIFTEDGSNSNSNVKQPTITIQEIGDRTIKAIVDETRGSKTDQIAKVLVNTNANVSLPVSLNTSHTYNLHNSYTPSVSDTGTIIIIVNFALYISFHSNLTSEVKLELLLNNPNNNSIQQERTITLKEMAIIEVMNIQNIFQ